LEALSAVHTGLRDSLWNPNGLYLRDSQSNLKEWICTAGAWTILGAPSWMTYSFICRNNSKSFKYRNGNMRQYQTSSIGFWSTSSYVGLGLHRVLSPSRVHRGLGVTLKPRRVEPTPTRLPSSRLQLEAIYVGEVPPSKGFPQHPRVRATFKAKKTIHIF
jgi:hypothetical protein